MRFLQDRVKELQGLGQSGLDLVTSVASETSKELHVHVDSDSVNFVRREIEKEKLRSCVLSKLSFPILVRYGEKILSLQLDSGDFNATATIGALANLQTNYPDAYVCCSVDNGIISYIYFSLPG